MKLNLNDSKPLQYISYFILFLISQCLSMWGQYITLPYKNLTYWQSISMAIPYGWADWFFLTFAIDIGHKYKLVSPTQDIFLLIILQFILILLINNFYLKQKIYRSDIIAFGLLLIGYFISFFKIASKLINIPIYKESKKKSKRIKHLMTYKNIDKQNT
jgi:hypothetical protein